MIVSEDNPHLDTHLLVMLTLLILLEKYLESIVT
jgi:hypothetical protein